MGRKCSLDDRNIWTMRTTEWQARVTNKDPEADQRKDGGMKISKLTWVTLPRAVKERTSWRSLREGYVE